MLIGAGAAEERSGCGGTRRLWKRIQTERDVNLTVLKLCYWGSRTVVLLQITVLRRGLHSGAPQRSKRTRTFLIVCRTFQNGF